MEHFRCPRMASEGAEELLAAVEDVEAGFGFPAPGPLCDQSAFFADGLHYAKAEKDRIGIKRATAAAEVRDMLGSP
jgi:hypothetical protein